MTGERAAESDDMEIGHLLNGYWSLPETRYPTPCMLNEKRPPLPDTHTPAREKSLNFFAFRQQQMGDWPINCCDALGLPRPCLNCSGILSRASLPMAANSCTSQPQRHLPCYLFVG